MDISLSIVGTAGRKDDSKRLSLSHFSAMCVVAEGLIDQINESNYKITTLVSGGAAYADHVAVKLFLKKKVDRLKLFMPAEWDHGSYKDNGARDPMANPGGTANFYHKQFQNTTRIHSLSDIQMAKNMGAELIPVKKGFYARNSLVAKSDFILAMTFGNKNEVKDGGTADTINKYLNRVRKEGIFDKSFHYDLNSGEIFVGCTVSSEFLKKLKE